MIHSIKPGTDIFENLTKRLPDAFEDWTTEQLFTDLDKHRFEMGVEYINVRNEIRNRIDDLMDYNEYLQKTTPQPPPSTNNEGDESQTTTPPRQSAKRR